MDPLVIINAACIVVTLFFMNRLLGASSKYAWNPGDNEIQGRQRIIILQCLVVVAAIGILAAIVNVGLG